MFLGYFAKTCLDGLKSALEKKTIGIDTSWGGLGGSLGGWNVSNSLAWFVATLIAFVLFFALTLHVHDGMEAAAAASGPQKMPRDSKNDANPSTQGNAASGQPVDGTNKSAGDTAKAATGTDNTSKKADKPNPEKK
jgi:hypothetical protein